MNHTLKLIVDGYSAEFKEKSQIKLVNHICELMTEHNRTANTYRKLIEIYCDKDIK